MGYQERNLKDYLKLVVSGFLMGASDIIPGVSGGTMAFILGIYRELIDSIRQINKSFVIKFASLRLRNLYETFPWRFLAAVGTGIALAIFSLAHSLEWLIKTYPAQTWAFFFGLVFASVFTVSRRVTRWTYVKVVWLIAGAVGAYTIVGLTPAQTPDVPWFLVLSGALAITAMILPGISGAFILLILGKYQTVLTAVTDRDFITIGYVFVGAVIGLLTVAQVLGYLFKRYHDYTVAVLAGFMLGSLRKLWPFKEVVATTVNRHGEVVPLIERNILPPTINAEALFVIIAIILGFVFVAGLNKLALTKHA